MTGPEMKAMLKRLRINQGTLATALGVAGNTVSRWAIGKLPVPRYAVSYLHLVDQYQAIKEERE